MSRIFLPHPFGPFYEYRLPPLINIQWIQSQSSLQMNGKPGKAIRERLQIRNRAKAIPSCAKFWDQSVEKSMNWRISEVSRAAGWLGWPIALRNESIQLTNPSEWAKTLLFPLNGCGRKILDIVSTIKKYCYVSGASQETVRLGAFGSRIIERYFESASLWSR